MTLEDLIARYRQRLADETVGVRRSWEEMFTHTLRHYPKGTRLQDFDPGILSERLSASGMHHPIAAGYVKRWREILARAGDL